MSPEDGPQAGEGCPICHRPLTEGEPEERVPVCPLVYPDVVGLRCHASCLAAERERNRRLRVEDLRPSPFRARPAGSRGESAAHERIARKDRT